MEGEIFGKVVAGLTGAIIVWGIQRLWQWLYQSKKSQAEFRNDIIEFSNSIKDSIPLDKIPSLMALVVPLASKARFGIDSPPLLDNYIIPSNVKLNCKVCKQEVKATTEGRCKTCKLSCSLWHDEFPD